MESFGSTTWKLKRLSKGAEADACFYLASASRIAYKDRDVDFDLEVDPPPDIVVEIDVSHQSSRKFPIYAAFGVPEIWRVKGGHVEFHELHGEGYVETAASRSFPMLTSAVAARFLDQAKREGPMPALTAFRRWVRKHQGP